MLHTHTETATVQKLKNIAKCPVLYIAMDEDGTLPTRKAFANADDLIEHFANKMLEVYLNENEESDTNVEVWHSGYHKTLYTQAGADGLPVVCEDDHTQEISDMAYGLIRDAFMETDAGRAEARGEAMMDEGR